MNHLDKQISVWKDKMKRDIKIPDEFCDYLASTIKQEIESLKPEEKKD